MVFKTIRRVLWDCNVATISARQGVFLGTGELYSTILKTEHGLDILQVDSGISVKSTFGQTEKLSCRYFQTRTSCGESFDAVFRPSFWEKYTENVI